MKLLDQSESELASYCKYRLANGLTVIVAQRPHTRTFGICMEVNVGMRDGNPHVAHLVEHLVLARVSRQSTRTDYLNGCTQFTRTRYFMSAHLDELDSGLEMVKNVLSPLDVEKKQVRNEIAILASEFSEAGVAQRIVDREHCRVLGGDDLATRYKKALDQKRLSIDAEEANAFHKSNYFPSNATVAIVSPLEPSLVFEKIVELVVGIENSVESPRETVSSKATEFKKRFHSSWHPGMATVCIWHKMLQVDFSDRVALDFLGRMILGGSSGRLFEELRVKNSLCYGVYDSFEYFEDTFWHNALINVAPMKARNASRILNQVFESIMEPIARKEFENKVLANVQRCEIAEEDKWSLLVGLLNWSAGDKALLPPHEIKKATLELTPERVAEVGKRFFAKENRHWLLSGCFGPVGYASVRQLS